MAMNKKVLGIGAGAVALVGVVLAVFVFEVQTAFMDDVVDERFETSDSATLLARGSFHEVVHAGKGKVEIYRDGDTCTVRLSDFAIDNGPTLRLRLVDIDDATDNDSVKKAGFVDLGELKGNIGNQSYTLPESFDDTKHRALVVWCERFGVNFVTAPLEPLAVSP